MLVNPSGRHEGTGLAHYTQAVLAEVRQLGIDAVFIGRDARVPREEAERFVRDTVTTHFRPEEVLIEAPEVMHSTLLLPRAYRVHVRLHGPLALVRLLNGRSVDRTQLARELEAVRQAQVVSSPSHALLRELAPRLDVSRFHVYKNPPPPGIGLADRPPPSHDVVFLARFRRVKGVDFLNAVLSGLPASYSVLLAGPGSDTFELAPSVKCRVTVRGEVRGPERYRLLGGARVALTLSRFENCSMMVLECLAVGTVVVGWRVGGHGEIAGPDLVRLVPFGDTEALVAAVIAAVGDAPPSPEVWGAATARVAADFRAGWRRVWDAVGEGSFEGVYRGLDCQPAAAAGSDGAPEMQALFAPASHG